MKQPDTTTPVAPVTEEASPPPKEMSVTFSFEIGRLLRDDMIYQVRSLALRCGVRIEIAENRGWIESAYTLRVSGAHSRLKVFCDSYNAWIRRLNR